MIECSRFAALKRGWLGSRVRFGVVLGFAVACGRAPLVQFDGSAPALTVHHPALYPETIEYDSKGDQFLLGSFREGAIYKVDRYGGASLFVDDPRLCSVLGMAVDAARNRVWAVNSDLGASLKPSALGPKSLSAVAAYDLSSGRALQYVDLASLARGPHLLNGIALDSAGNVYVTDSFSPIIYKIDVHAVPSVLLRDERFSGAGINLNGVVVHPDGYLLVIKKSDGVLFKVPLREPARFSRVELSEPLVGGDGLTLVGKRGLVVIANQTPTQRSNAAYSLLSDDDWATAKIVATEPLGDAYPTTSVLRQGTLYVVQSRLNELIALPPESKAQLRVEATIRSIARVTQ